MKAKREVIAPPAIKQNPSESSYRIKNVLICSSLTFYWVFRLGTGRLLLPATDVENRPDQLLLEVTGWGRRVSGD